MAADDVMEKVNKQGVSQEPGSFGDDSLICQMCGRILQPEESNWDAEAGKGMLCRYCKAEGDSCGCSD